MNFCSVLYRAEMEVQKITNELQQERSPSSRTRGCSEKPALAYVNVHSHTSHFISSSPLPSFDLFYFYGFSSYRSVFFLLFPFLFLSLKIEIIDLLLDYFAYHIIVAHINVDLLHCMSIKILIQ